MHPRWVRVNTIRTTLEKQLATTFAGYRRVASIEEFLKGASESSSQKLLHVDDHVSDLLALPSTLDLTGTIAYRKGEIVLQDKASCFPAYLLNPVHEDGEIIDACAAPGNKTTHIAAILQGHNGAGQRPTVIACEKNNDRAVILQKMIDWAGAKDMVRVKAGQDFLRLDPDDKRYSRVGALLLDPSCSGSGIVGRDDVLRVVLPSEDAGKEGVRHGKKRKRSDLPTPSNPAVDLLVEEESNVDMSDKDRLSARLKSLSTFQKKLVLHALRFPSARKITYSTCSVHASENEHVVMEVLKSDLAKRRGWRIQTREEQVAGMRAWNIRGDRRACQEFLADTTEETDSIAAACIRCEKGTKEGTMGFFVACFVRDDLGATDTPVEDPVGLDLRQCEAGSDRGYTVEDVEWQGFDDDDSPVTISDMRKAKHSTGDLKGKHIHKHRQGNDRRRK